MVQTNDYKANDILKAEQLNNDNKNQNEAIDKSLGSIEVDNGQLIGVQNNGEKQEPVPIGTSDTSSVWIDTIKKGQELEIHGDVTLTGSTFSFDEDNENFGNTQPFLDMLASAKVKLYALFSGENKTLPWALQLDGELKGLNDESLIVYHTDKDWNSIHNLSTDDYVYKVDYRQGFFRVKNGDDTLSFISPFLIVNSKSDLNIQSNMLLLGLDRLSAQTVLFKDDSFSVGFDGMISGLAVDEKNRIYAITINSDSNDRGAIKVTIDATDGQAVTYPVIFKGKATFAKV